MLTSLRNCRKMLMYLSMMLSAPHTGKISSVLVLILVLVVTLVWLWSFSHTLSPPHCYPDPLNSSLTLSFPLSVSPSNAASVTHTLPYTPSLSLTHPHSHPHSLTPSHSLTLTHPHSLSHTITLRAHASTEGVTAFVATSVAGFLLQKELDYLQGNLIRLKYNAKL